jgi:hypothetical protein
MKAQANAGRSRNVSLCPPTWVTAMALMIATFIGIVAFVFAIIFLIVDLARLPGEIARHRGHPQADAVKIAGIIGIVTGVAWPIALIWAYLPYPRNIESETVQDTGSLTANPRKAQQ